VNKRNLVTQLRSEVRDVKDCFTRFAFQGSALATVVMGFILNAHERPEVAWVAVPTIFLLMLICRVAIFKYTTANRNLGYELHLDRLATYVRNGDFATRARVAQLEGIGWEEALRAWRVVQASIFAALYKVPQIEADRSSILPEKLFKRWRWPRHLDPGLFCLKGKAQGLEAAADHLYDFRDDAAFADGPYAWWNQKKLTEHNDGSGISSHYHTGNFLKDVLFGLNVMQWSLFLLLTWSVIPFLWDRRLPLAEGLCLVIVIALLGAVMAARQIRVRRRRLILEEELVSIHSCAITWAAVTIVHVAAAGNTRRPYFHYTERLARLCRHIEPTSLPTAIGRYVFEGKSIFGEGAHHEGLVDTRVAQRRCSVVPFTGDDRRKQERRSKAS
jgi:hypothetical protein